MKTEEGKTLADSLGIKFLETSAKDAVNVEKAFTTLSNEIKSKVQSKPGNASRSTSGASSGGTTTLTKEAPKKDKSGCC